LRAGRLSLLRTILAPALYALVLADDPSAAMLALAPPALVLPTLRRTPCTCSVMRWCSQMLPTLRRTPCTCSVCAGARRCSLRRTPCTGSAAAGAGTASASAQPPSLREMMDRWDQSHGWHVMGDCCFVGLAGVPLSTREREPPFSFFYAAW